MSKNILELVALNWKDIVAEAVKRRKSERLTQKEHAALANVSIPTIAAFDRGEETLTLAKAFDILRVVGLIQENSSGGQQEAFVKEAFLRWKDLISALPKNSPGRMPYGWYRIDYELQGNLKDLDIFQFEKILKKATLDHTGWPAFIHLTRSELKPYEVDGLVECWVRPGDGESIDRIFYEAAHCDFWRGIPGRMFLLRGYDEDGGGRGRAELLPPGTIFDSTLPIWRLGEALLHAANLADMLKSNSKSEIIVKFRVLYSGLSGRALRSWARSYQSPFTLDAQVAKSDEAMLEVSVRADDIKNNLSDYIYPMIASLYERFGVSNLSREFVKYECGQLLNSRVEK